MGQNSLKNGRSSADPEAANVYIDAFLQRHGVPSARIMFELKDRWRGMFTGRLANARPIVIIDRCLVLRVRSRGDAQMLRYATNKLLDGVNGMFGSDTVAAVRFVVDRH